MIEKQLNSIHASATPLSLKCLADPQYIINNSFGVTEIYQDNVQTDKFYLFLNKVNNERKRISLHKNYFKCACQFEISYIRRPLPNKTLFWIEITISRLIRTRQIEKKIICLRKQLIILLL